MESAMLHASVVFPTWRGPMIATTPFWVANLQVLLCAAFRVRELWLTTVDPHFRQGLLPGLFDYSCLSPEIGIVNEKTEPSPNWLTTPIVPPCASTMTFAIARPIPVPWAA